MRVVNWMNKALHDDSGATAIEYGLIVALIAIAIIGALGDFADEVSTMYSDVDSAVDANLN